MTDRKNGPDRTPVAVQPPLPVLQVEDSPARPPPEAGDLEKLWEAAKRELQLQLPRATFDAWLRGSEVAGADGEELVVRVRNPYAVDWLHNGGLQEVISRTVARLARRPVAIRFVGPEAGEEISLEGAYRDPQNEIVRPDRVAVCTQYFRTQWAPLLGPVLTLAIWELRQRCYYGGARRQGESEAERRARRRDTCTARLEDIAAVCGVSVRTLRRHLNENPHVGLFILSREPIYALGPDGRPRHVSNVWRIVLDDPLTPDDARRLAEAKGEGDSRAET